MKYIWNLNYKLIRNDGRDAPMTPNKNKQYVIDTSQQIEMNKYQLHLNKN